MKNLLNSKLNNTFTNELPADKELKNFTRQVEGACYSYAEPKKTKKPKLLISSKEMIKTLGIKDPESESFLNIVTGNELISNSKPYAMCYGGHQFGNWAGQLGDGRAINLGQIENEGKTWAIQLKGAGETPYSRRADGLAVLRSSVREFLCSEAMYHLGVSTTRALSLSLSGDEVLRDMLYDGNAALEKGAIVCRVSESFVRFGSFQIFAARQDFNNLKKLVDHTIKHHYVHLGEPSKETYLKFLEEVIDRTKKMIINWQRIGFVHGVMNTDNMSILGQTIDYGPYGWLEDYNPHWTPNTTDSQNKRYRFGNQANIALWNLTQLANALYPLIEEVEPLQKILESYRDSYVMDYKKMMAEKLGLYSEESQSAFFIDKLEENLSRSETDYIMFFRELSSNETLNYEKFWNIVKETSYLEETDLFLREEGWKKWFADYDNFIKVEDFDKNARSSAMKKINPKYVLRNYMAQLAIDEADKGNYKLLDELHELLKNPYDEQAEMEKWYAKRPDWAKHKVGCSMLSCSS